MRKIYTTVGLLFIAVLSLNAQTWTKQDSLNLDKLLNGVGEINLNIDAVNELKADPQVGEQKISLDKQWLNFDLTLPKKQHEPKKKVILTLRPYSANTKYNWDPVYQKNIKVDKNTWRSDPFYELKSLFIYSNWAKNPLDKGIRNSVEEIEATGMRYRSTERANNMAVGGWQSANGNGLGGMDLMKPFTKDFWDVKGRKRRARTLEVLQSYGDSISVYSKDP